MLCVHAYYTNVINLLPPYPFRIQINNLVKPSLKYISHHSSIFYGLLQYPSTEKPKGYKQIPQKYCLKCTKLTFHSSLVFVATSYARLKQFISVPCVYWDTGQNWASVTWCWRHTERSLLRKTLKYRTNSPLMYLSVTLNCELSRSLKESSVNKGKANLTLPLCLSTSKPQSETLKAGDLRTRISRCQVCMKKT